MDTLLPTPLGTESTLVEALLQVCCNGRTVLTADLAAHYIGVSKGYLLELARDQQIPSSKKSKYVYFRRSDLDKWMAGD